MTELTVAIQVTVIIIYVMRMTLMKFYEYVGAGDIAGIIVGYVLLLLSLVVSIIIIIILYRYVSAVY